MLGALLVALAGPGYVNSEVPDPLGPMTLSNLTAATDNAGACPAGSDPIPSPSASIRLTFRAVNRDDDAYRVDVYLLQPGSVFIQGAFKLGSPPVDGGFMQSGWAPKEWEQGWTDIVSGFGVFTYTGYVESGPAAPYTVDWTFLVQLIRLEDEAVVQELRAPWKKTYGTCS